ncbi:MAG TPA: FG-GAP-like repeat-containing protein, partial [Thermoanaerobaculia bacterium]|nr:FG-GAP-like repeat-containing protein [Thermoanaerobaculia bacterium]
DQRPGFSNYGRATVHISAPGVGILSTTPGNTYTSLDGTSMAAPQVSGVVALLHAQVPGRDSREVKNLILAGGETRASLSSILSRKRLSARGALSCSDSLLAARLQPVKTEVLTGSGGLELAALNINCGAPAGDVVVTIGPSGATITLHDDGSGRDQLAGDGVYTGSWIPPAGGVFSLGYPDGSIVQVTVDPQLEPGFPVQAFHGPGSYQGGQAVNALVGNIDGDAALEIVATGLAGGPLYAWKADGRPVPGWPVVDAVGAAYTGLGELDEASPGLEVVDGHFSTAASIVARRGSGLPLPGWPKTLNYVAAPPSLADVDGDGLDEIFTEQEDWKLHAYRASGAPLAGWPPAEPFVGGQERHTPAIADLDGDGDLEIVTASGSIGTAGFNGVYLLAYHHDGTTVSGFPVQVSNGYTNTFPVIGDVDGDGQLEIVVATRVTGSPTWSPGLVILSAAGVIERTLVAGGELFYGTAPALADLDGDGVPEILMQTNGAVHAWKGNGQPVPGWPVS